MDVMDTLSNSLFSVNKIIAIFGLFPPNETPIKVNCEYFHHVSQFTT